MFLKMDKICLTPFIIYVFKNGKICLTPFFLKMDIYNG